MRKLKLELETLNVETFAPAAEEEGGIVSHQIMSGEQSCHVGYTCDGYNTCQNTCVRTGAPQNTCYAGCIKME